MVSGFLYIPPLINNLAEKGSRIDSESKTRSQVLEDLRRGVPPLREEV
jgi:hypothetical protein